MGIYLAIFGIRLRGLVVYDSSMCEFSSILKNNLIIYLFITN